MLTDKKKAEIQMRLSDNAPYTTPGEWYHEDVPMLLREIDIALKTCPSGGNDGYITPRPCQMANCEDCHAEHEATTDGIKADRDYWKSRAEALEKALRLTSGCNSCYHSNAPGVTKISFVGQKVCMECGNKRNNWQFDQERFTDRPPTTEAERKGSDGV